MRITKQKNILKKRLLVLSIILFCNLFIIGLNLIDFSSIENNDYNRTRGLNQLPISPETPISSDTYDVWYYDEQMLTNTGFDTEITPWTNDTSNAGNSLSPSYTANEADFEVLGDRRTFSFVQDPPTDDGDWLMAEDPNFPYYPDTPSISGSGFDVDHRWAEGADQSVAVTWRRNFTMPVNMSDYEITTASILSEVSGQADTFSADPPDYSDGVEAGNDLGTRTNQYATGDYTRFYILVSDIYDINKYEIAYNQTSILGQDSPAVGSTGVSYMIPVTEDTLKIYLTSVLNNDGYNFTLIMGIRIWCEDNFPQDSDDWYNIIISSVNLTFNYEKKIEQLSSVSWNQQGNQITNVDNPVIENATLQIDYKTNQTWTATTGSQNSEIRFYINNELHSETIKLRDSTTTYQNATFVVTSKVAF